MTTQDIIDSLVQPIHRIEDYARDGVIDSDAWDRCEAAAIESGGSVLVRGQTIVPQRYVAPLLSGDRAAIMDCIIDCSELRGPVPPGTARIQAGFIALPVMAFPVRMLSDTTALARAYDTGRMTIEDGRVKEWEQR